MITVLTGPNQLAIFQKLKELTESFVASFGEAGVERYEADMLELGQLTSLVGGATLFADNRFIVIKNLSANKILAEAFLRQIPHISAEVSVVLAEPSPDKRTSFYKELKKQAEIIEFAEMDTGAAAGWVRDYVASEGGVITPSEANTLVMHIGCGQLQLRNEIDKLVAYNTKITEESISQLVEKTPQDSIFELLELALGGKKKQALAVLDSMERSRQDVFALANMLIWQAHVVAVVYSAGSISEREISASTKINPYVVQKTKKLTSRLTTQSLRTIISAVCKCDVQLKTSSTDPWRVIEQAILAF